MAKQDTRTYKIALDAMGGDFAPINEIQGAIRTLERNNADIDLEVVLVGNEKKINAALSQLEYGELKFSIVHADEVITMNDDPTTALKTKRNSSVHKGLELHKQGYVDAFISSGNTGAVLSAATVMMGRIKGVSRPTIGSFFPTQGKFPSLVLDVGANIECKPRFLYEFAIMGSIYATQIFGLENPRIGLLNVGEEPTKGTQNTKETFQMISDSNLNFIGNVEGRDILLGSADVVVCDGFTGNIVLKFAESFLSFFKSKLKSFAASSFLNKLMILAVKPVLKKIFKEFDYQEYGGVPLLGINGNVIIGHGKSTPKAIETMIIKAVELVKKDVNKKIEYALNPDFIKENNIEK